MVKKITKKDLLLVDIITFSWLIVVFVGIIVLDLSGALYTTITVAVPTWNSTAYFEYGIHETVNQTATVVNTTGCVYLGLYVLSMFSILAVRAVFRYLYARQRALENDDLQ